MKKLIWMSVVVAGLYVAWRGWQGRPAVSDSGDPQLVFDRLWVDHLPRDERDTYQMFVAISEQPLGAFESRAFWKGSWELFRYERAEDGRLTLRFPHSEEEERAAVRATRCQAEGFDYCLELERPRGKQRYYSRRGWELGKAATPDALLDQIGHLRSLVDGRPGEAR